MNPDLKSFSQQYATALQKHLRPGSDTGFATARGLGRRAMALGLETLDLAHIHELALLSLALPGEPPPIREVMVRRAGKFFAEAITPIERTHRTALQANVNLGRANQLLRQRCADLTAAARQLREEVAQRATAEQSLKRSERHYAQLLAQSHEMQEQLRRLSRELLAAQEEERKMISRELHDVVAQMLASINLRLADLKQAATINTGGFAKNLASTQQLVQNSVEIVHRFARELRPTVLDDLGLIPALHTFLKSFQKETGVQVRLSADAAVEQVSGPNRTTLYRVAQAALTNVARHARANRVAVTIHKKADAVVMTITDDGCGFQLDGRSRSKPTNRLGLLGMNERLEMVGGGLSISSSLGKGTTVEARVPLSVPAPKKAKLSPSLN